MHFSSDAIDVKQSVESTFKVWGRSLTTALNEVHFIVNLYSFPQHLVSQANPYPSQPFANPPPPPRRSNSQTPRLEPAKWQIVLITTLVLHDQPQGYILSYFQKLPRALPPSPEHLLNFLSNFYIPPCVENIFKFMEFTFVENALIRGIFIHVPPNSKLTSKYLSSRTRQKKITYSSRQYSFENLFPPTAESGGGNYDLLYQNSARKYEVDLDHQVFYIFSSVMALQFYK